MSRLLAHDWPGNVRELRNTLRRAVALSDRAIGAADLGLDVPTTFQSSCELRIAYRAADARESLPPPATLPARTCKVTEGGTLELAGKTFEEMQTAIFRWALIRNHGSRRRAALSLGVSRSTFCDRVRKLGLTEAGTSTP